MTMSHYLPTGILSHYIKAYVIIESEEELINRVLPGTSYALAFRYRGQISYLTDTGNTALPGVTFSGMRKSARLINYAPKSSSLIVLFREMALPSFFRQPLHELFGESVSLDTFFPQSEIAMIEEQLAEGYDHMEKIEIVAGFLYSKLVPQKSDILIAAAIRKISETNGLVRINELARNFSISQDAFEKRFRKATGTTPKQFAFIIRMKAVISQRPDSFSFLDLAIDNGYYDQPHFNKDFKLFTGQTPTDFFKSDRYW